MDHADYDACDQPRDDLRSYGRDRVTIDMRISAVPPGISAFITS
jgi:hypothetical protein